jgi:hypothetical protein
MSIRSAVTAYRIGQALHLTRTLRGMVELGVPTPPRRLTARDQTLITSLRVIARELEKAIADLDQDGQEVRRTA